MIDRADITAVILCGGAGARYGGRDKPLESLAGVPLVAHVRRRLAPQVGSIVISANRNAAEYARWGDAVVADEKPSQGPLGGILAAIHRASTRFLFACPGDAPRLPATLVERLAGALERDASDIAVPHDGERLQPLFMLVRRSIEPQLRRYLDDGERSVHGFVERLRCAVIDASDAATGFVNVNSPADLDAAALAAEHR